MSQYDRVFGGWLDSIDDEPRLFGRRARRERNMAEGEAMIDEMSHDEETRLGVSADQLAESFGLPARDVALDEAVLAVLCASSPAGEPFALRHFKRDRVEATRAALRKILDPLTTEIANLRASLVAEGHREDCPVVLGGSMDCVPGGGCDARSARAAYGGYCAECECDLEHCTCDDDTA